MGLDFIQQTKKTLKTKWDRERVKLGTADMLTRTPKKAGCSAAFDMIASAKLREGQDVNVESEGSALVVRRGQSIVARKDDPPPQLLKAVRESCGIANGKIERVHGPAGVIEILLC